MFNDNIKLILINNNIMKTFLIIVLVIIAGFVSYYLFNYNAEAKKYSQRQNQTIKETGEGILSFHDIHGNFDKDIDFINKEANVNFGDKNEKSVHYKIIDVLQPLNLDKDEDTEYPFLMDANYSDGTKITYLVIADKTSEGKFKSADQIIVGPSDQIDDIHSYNQNELIIDSFFTDESNIKQSVLLSYTFSKDKITPGKGNIDIANPPKKEVKSSPISTNNQSNNNSNDGTNGKVALSFDDGPGIYTQSVLDVLRDKNVKATFFMIGQNAEGRNDDVKNVANAGHEIGDHTYTHPDMSKLSADAQKDEIQKTKSILQGILSQLKVNWFRPPYGNFNDDTVSVLNSLGVQKILWNVDTRDWSGISSSDIFNAATSNVFDGAVILMHDGVANSSETAKALPDIIDNIKSKGYKIVTVSEIMNK